MKIYVASSWRNEVQPKVVEALRNLIATSEKEVLTFCV